MTTPQVGQGKECFCMSLWPIWVRVMIFESHEMQTTGLRTVIQKFNCLKGQNPAARWPQTAFREITSREIAFVAGVNENVGIKGDHEVRPERANVQGSRTSSPRSPPGAAAGPRACLRDRRHRRVPR